MKKTVHVRSGNSSYCFEFFLHFSKSPEEHMIEKGFYEQHFVKHAPPEGVHYEIEVLTDLSVAYPRGQHKNVHIHRSTKPLGGDFICWTQQVDSLEKAIALMQLWALGTVYTLENGPSFGTLIHTYDGMSLAEINNRRGVIEGQGIVLVEPVEA